MRALGHGSRRVAASAATAIAVGLVMTLLAVGRLPGEVRNQHEARAQQASAAPSAGTPVLVP